MEEKAAKLQQYIEQKEGNKLRELLGPIVEETVISQLESYFEGVDPVNLAIFHDDEVAACYLVEKGFSVTKLYQGKLKCDQWCYNNHGSERCPSSVDSADHAVARDFFKLKTLIDSVKQGTWKPGETLPTTQPAQIIPKPPTGVPKPQSPRPLPASYRAEKSATDDARDVLRQLGNLEADKNGNTLLHSCAKRSAEYVYVFANGGVPVNVQNKDGDTALHVAVRKQRINICESLLQCGADLSIRNRLGQTPSDEATGHIKELVQRFEPGLVLAVCQGNHHHVTKLVKTLWCSTETIVKEGKTIMRLGDSRSSQDKNIENCMRVLKDYRKTSELTHAVLCENIYKVTNILNQETGWTLNSRYQDRLGKTLLSCAIERNNLELVRCLVDGEARVNNIRVRETNSNATVPLYHKALRRTCPIEIPKFLHSVQDKKASLEKDGNGNTAILKAISENCSARLIEWMLVAHSGSNLAHRNEDGMTPRELALKLKNHDIVRVIDKFRMNSVLQVQLAVRFYGDNIVYKDEKNTKSPTELPSDKEEIDLKNIQNYRSIENNGIRLFEASASGDLDQVEKLNNAHYQDKNGFTALTRAVVHDQYEVAKLLCTERPQLKLIPDNCNRYPLHYAYALPDEVGQKFIRLFLERNSDEIERRNDKDGRVAADYKNLRHTDATITMLMDAQTLDAYGKHGFLMRTTSSEIANDTSGISSALDNDES